MVRAGAWRLVLAAAVACAAGCRPVPVHRLPAMPRSPASPERPPPRLGAAPSPESQLVYLRLKLDERRVYVIPVDVLHGTDGAIESYPVAVGRRGYDTPIGRFQVTEKVVDPDFVLFDDWDHPSRMVRRIPPGPDNPLGQRWIGFASGYGWTIGFHGTPHPELLGRAVSHGCVRMRNSDVVKLYDRVAIGTTVIVEP